MLCGCVGKQQRQYWRFVKDEKYCRKASVWYFKIFFKDPITFVKTVGISHMHAYHPQHLFGFCWSWHFCFYLHHYWSIFALDLCVCTPCLCWQLLWFLFRENWGLYQNQSNCMIHPQKECSSKKYCYSSCKRLHPLHQHDCRVCHHCISFCVSCLLWCQLIDVCFFLIKALLFISSFLFLALMLQHHCFLFCL